MNHLLLADAADAMHIHRAALDHIKSARRIAFVKKVVTLFQRFHYGHIGDVYQVGRRQAGEKLAAAQRVDDGSCFEIG
jgi:hypothetical protein